MSERQQKSLKMKSGYVAAFIDYHSYAEVPCMEKSQMLKVSKVSKVSKVLKALLCIYIYIIYTYIYIHTHIRLYACSPQISHCIP